MNTNLFALAGISVAVVCFLLAFFILMNAKAKHHRLWALFNIVVGIFGLGTYFVGVAKTYDEAFWAWKLTLFGVSLIAMFFYLVVYEFCNLKNKKLLYFVYAHGILFSAITIFTNLSFSSLKFAFNQFYYYKAGIGFNVFFLIWIVIVFQAFVNLFLYIRMVKGIKLKQANYLFWGMLFGFAGGSTTSFPGWGINIYPAWHFFICIYITICTYAIFKYSLMDLRIVVTRLGVFSVVYSLVLGIPFALATWGRTWLVSIWGGNWFLVPMISLVILSTAGPFIYLYVQKRAEERLFQEQLRYQATLRQASIGMGRIKDLKRLLNLIVHIVTRTVRLEHSMVYILDHSSGNFLLGASKSRKIRFKPLEAIHKDSVLVKQLLANHLPVVYDEIRQRTQDYGDLNLARLENELMELNAALVVPSFVEDNLMAVIILGNKISGGSYSNEDLTVFSILANQAALAIENAQFYDDMKKTHEQLFKAEKMATIGTMADGLSHQINNRLHALGFIAGDVLDTIKLKRNVPMPPEIKEMMVDIEHALTRIQENVTQGGDIVRGLLKYSRKAEEGFSEVSLDKLVDAAVEMTQFKIKPGELMILKEYQNTLPKIKGNFTQLQEVFFNLIDNAYDAMMEKKHDLKEQDYKPTIKISANYNGDSSLDILFEDNGMGIKEENKDKLFTPFYTTKASSRKGTGLGLYVIQKLIEENHHGKVVYSSEYKKGTRVQIHLPVWRNAD